MRIKVSINIAVMVQFKASSFTHLLLFMLFACIAHRAHTCKCVQKPLHEAFCHADFAILARVTTLKRIMEYQRHLYNFRILPIRIFRQDKPIFVRGVPIVAFTPRSENLCHAKVKRGELYLLGGRVKGRRVFLTSCGLIEKWYSLQHIIRKSIRQGKISCKCTVQGCDGHRCVVRNARTKRPVSHSCENVSQLRKGCYKDYGMCIYKNKRCRWSKRSTKLVSNCVSRKNNLVIRGRVHKGTASPM